MTIFFAALANNEDYDFLFEGDMEFLEFLFEGLSTW